MKIDCYTHFSFETYLKYLERNSKTPFSYGTLFRYLKTMLDVDSRLALMEKYQVDKHVIIPLPWIESVKEVYEDSVKAHEAAKILNNELANLVNKFSDKFIPVGVIPTTNIDIMLAEYERVIYNLKFKGIYLVVGPTVRPIDDSLYDSLFKKAVQDNVPVWLHPSRPITYSDYINESMSKYGIWQSIGWLMDSSTAMIRLTLSGAFEKYKGIKFIIHHHGALIGLFSKRLNAGFRLFKNLEAFKSTTTITEPFIEHFKNFYVDTATQGFEPLLIQNAYMFFGIDHVLFGTDVPFDENGGYNFTNETICSINSALISDADKEKIFYKNIVQILNLKVS
ncbi:MAG TPA: amidohydrolase family protein [Thermodesulfovibrio thiophilus]|nr:amidohydrolase family protein [Thermodesulfovibrio thiophilus]HQD36235.1 amidohydrolase family protein [Thermodesulfovibrio thiophilus]